MKNTRSIEQAASDAIVQKPIELSLRYDKPLKTKKFSFKTFKFVNSIPVVETFKIYPPSLGKLQLLSKLFLQLGLDIEEVKMDPATEIFKCCSDKSDILAEIMAVAVLRTKEELLNSSLIEERKQLFLWYTTPEDFSIIVGAILMQIDLTNFSNSIRLTKLFRLNEPKESRRGANRVEK